MLFYDINNNNNNFRFEVIEKSKWLLIYINICQLAILFSLYILLLDEQSLIYTKIFFFFIYITHRLRIFLLYQKNGIIEFLELLFLIEIKPFKKNTDKNINYKEFDKISTIIPCIVQFIIEFCFRNNSKPQYFLSMTLSIILLSYLAHQNWLMSLQFSLMIVITLKLQSLLYLQIGFLFLVAFYFFELIMILFFYEFVFKLVRSKDIDGILIGYLISNLLGVCLVTQKLNKQGIINFQMQKMLVEVQGFVSVNNLIFSFLFYKEISLLIQILIVAMLPIMIYQVYFLINFIVQGPFFVYYEIDLLNYEDTLQSLKSLQYFAEIHFKNFTEIRALKFMKQFLFLNPECFYTIKILNNNTDELQLNQMIQPICQQYFNINANSSQTLNFFLEAFYMSDIMSNNFTLIIFYQKYYRQFPQE
ncbi:transmembrane protein, putative (macronuclear) [Tetrahymena thermophila SB210]|uniref:Transmembrane protein, putative n=1 Tax=Tetrahymena thermophila (strain SB210) TaxID=312017 RepID=W7XGM9_TETTS|nr:transmembrane protein, putative [Tetrahymena thermophila SB210]EWS73311.1 transmembrane protein, putative [Tetrahymena thermophila SB210]|eukprot:XP_012654160.1 transmembrane protein, putative [Tetrahymena thermophila SB210]